MRSRFEWLILIALLFGARETLAKPVKKHVPAKTKITHQTKKVSRASTHASVLKKKSAFDRYPASMSAAAATGGSAPEDRVVKVKGQSRSLSMMLMVKDDKDRIKFGEIRDSFKEEVSKTNY